MSNIRFYWLEHLQLSLLQSIHPKAVRGKYPQNNTVLLKQASSWWVRRQVEEQPTVFKAWEYKHSEEASKLRPKT